MKLNWGTKIGAAYGVFVIFMIGMVYMSFGEKYDLVTEDYYAQEIAYQSKIDAKERLKNLDEPLQFSISNSHLQVKFPATHGQDIEGNINCFRPSDESKDFTVEVQNESSKLIPLSSFTKGKYLLKVEWNVGEETYYTEETVIIP